MSLEPSILAAPAGVPFDKWTKPAVVAKNNFRYKSLSNWSVNTAVGCHHGCRFCYVPETSTMWLAKKLKAYGVEDPDADWGKYALLRQFDFDKFLASVHRANETPVERLNPDGNRAVMYCTTTDPYQVFPQNNFKLTEENLELVKRTLTIIYYQSTLNVRILTRGPLAKVHFDLFKRFGKRLMFGMSIPTLNDKLRALYEPGAPAISQRIKTLEAAAAHGLNIFVAMAPTYPECDAKDLRRTLTAIKKLNPLTIFHEPINIRRENVERIEAYVKTIPGATVRTDVFKTPEAWRRYAFDSLSTVERLAARLGLSDRLHLWPDKTLASRNGFLKMKKASLDPSRIYTRHERRKLNEKWEQDFLQVEQWINCWHSRISEWP